MQPGEWTLHAYLPSSYYLQPLCTQIISSDWPSHLPCDGVGHPELKSRAPLNVYPTHVSSLLGSSNLGPVTLWLYLLYQPGGGINMHCFHFPP